MNLLIREYYIWRIAFATWLLKRTNAKRIKDINALIAYQAEQEENTRTEIEIHKIRMENKI